MILLIVTRQLNEKVIKKWYDDDDGIANYKDVMLAYTRSDCMFEWVQYIHKVSWKVKRCVFDVLHTFWQNLIECSNFRNISTAGERVWRRLWKYLSTDVFESYSLYKKNSIDSYRLEIEKIIGKHDCLEVN